MDTGAMERGAVAGPRRATHGEAVVDRSLVECSNSRDEEQDDKATGGGAGGGGHGGGLLTCTSESSAQYTGPDSTGGHFFALQFALTAAYPSRHMLSSSIPKSPPGTTVWIGDSTSSVNGTGSGKFVYNKRRSLPAESFPHRQRQRHKFEGRVFGVTRRRLALQG